MNVGATANGVRRRLRVRRQRSRCAAPGRQRSGGLENVSASNPGHGHAPRCLVDGRQSQRRAFSAIVRSSPARKSASAAASRSATRRASGSASGAPDSLHASRRDETPALVKILRSPPAVRVPRPGDAVAHAAPHTPPRACGGARPAVREANTTRRRCRPSRRRRRARRRCARRSTPRTGTCPCAGPSRRRRGSAGARRACGARRRRSARRRGRRTLATRSGAAAADNADVAPSTAAASTARVRCIVISPSSCADRDGAQPLRFARHAQSSPTMPRRNASTQTTKMAPVMTVTHWPNPAR